MIFDAKALSDERIAQGYVPFVQRAAARIKAAQAVRVPKRVAKPTSPVSPQAEPSTTPIIVSTSPSGLAPTPVAVVKPTQAPLPTQEWGNAVPVPMASGFSAAKESPWSTSGLAVENTAADRGDGFSAAVPLALLALGAFFVFGRK